MSAEEQSTTAETQKQENAENQDVMLAVESDEPNEKSGVGRDMDAAMAAEAEYQRGDRVSYRGTKNGAAIKVIAMVTKVELNKRTYKWEYKVSTESRSFSERELTWA